MAYRVFNIPAVAGSGDDAAELNVFLRGHKVVVVHGEFVQDGAAVAFSVAFGLPRTVHHAQISPAGAKPWHMDCGFFP